MPCTTTTASTSSRSSRDCSKEGRGWVRIEEECTDQDLHHPTVSNRRLLAGHPAGSGEPVEIRINPDLTGFKQDLHQAGMEVEGKDQDGMVQDGTEAVEEDLHQDQVLTAADHRRQDQDGTAAGHHHRCQAGMEEGHRHQGQDGMAEDHRHQGQAGMEEWNRNGITIHASPISRIPMIQTRIGIQIMSLAPLHKRQYQDPSFQRQHLSQSPPFPRSSHVQPLSQRRIRS